MTLASAVEVGPWPREAIAPLNGREVLEQMMAGRLPAPDFGVTMQIWPEEIGDGRVVFRGETGEAFRNPLGSVHGGWISTILDTAMACAIHSLLKPGQLYTTTSMTIQFTRALIGDGQIVRCEGVAIHAGGRVATAEGRLYDAKGRMIAHGSESCLIMEIERNKASAAA
ncbi:PaaI family thioesterase [Terrarubrum flagellatum]|uniref:PaaI family thioesterase n=1 Tax=Terrirubrum flagellatum TaxID=2895980 RepID=UPI003144FBAC